MSDDSIRHDCTGSFWPCPCGHLTTAMTGWGARLGRWWHRLGCRA